MIGETVSHYSIVETLGRGGMGVVYKAQDTKLGRFVALKFLSKEFRSDQRAMERFRQEARTASALNHPGICTVHDIDEHRGQPFIVMELLEGRTLRQQLLDRPLTTREAVEWGIQIADALVQAHAQGIVHCDITPANLFITLEGRIKLLDFGIAQLIREICPKKSSTVHARFTRSALTGTVRYMSPEQALGRDVDARSDIFSVGIVLHEMLTGRLPFNGADLLETIHQVIHRKPAAVRSINSSIPVAVETIVSKCLEKIPDRRYPGAAELQKDLMQVIEHHVPPSGAAQAIDRAAETHELMDPSLIETVPDLDETDRGMNTVVDTEVLAANCANDANGWFASFAQLAANITPTGRPPTSPPGIPKAAPSPRRRAVRWGSECGRRSRTVCE